MNYIRKTIKDFISTKIDVVQDGLLHVNFDILIDKILLCYDYKIKEKNKSIKIDGFRIGKAPKNIIEKFHGESIKMDLKNEIIVQAIEFFINNNKNYDIILYSLEKESSLIDLNFKLNLQFLVKFTISPKFILPEYIGIKLSTSKINIDQEQIDQKLNILKDLYGEFYEVEEKIKEGDLLHLSYKMNNLIIEKDCSSDFKKIIQCENISYLLSNNTEEILPNINKLLIGHKNNDIFNYSIFFPKDFKHKKLSNKTFKYEFKILKIERKKSVSEKNLCKKLKIDNIDILKNKIIKQINIEQDYTLYLQRKEEIISKLIENLDIIIPVELLDMATTKELQNLLSQDKELIEINNKQKNIDKNESLFNEKRNKYLLEAKKIAIKKMKIYLLFRKISKIEQIKVDKNDIKDYIDNIKKYYKNNESFEKISDNLISSGKINQIIEEIMIRKTIDFVINKSIII